MNIEIFLISFSFACVILFIGLFIVSKHERKNLLLKNKTKKKRSSLIDKFGTSLKYYLILMFSFIVIFGLVGYRLFSSIVAGIICAMFGFFLPLLVFRIIENHEKKHFGERYARGLRHLASGLKSGLTITQAIDETSKSPFIHESIRELFEQMNADLKVGMTVQTAFQRAADRLDNEDVQDVASAISMQAEVGGSEAIVIDTIANNISSRLDVKKEITSLFASTSITIWALDIIPFVILIFLAAVSPDFIAPFFESTDRILLFFGMIAFMFVGSFVMRMSVREVKSL